jgi:Fe-S-cluster-containing hydrogenase component 2
MCFECFDCMYACAQGMYSIHRNQKRSPNALKLELRLDCEMSCGYLGPSARTASDLKH